MKAHPLTAALTASMAVTLAACGASAAAGKPADQAQNAAAPASQSTGTQPGSGPAKNIDVCADLPARAASQITGTTFTKAKPSSVEGQVFSCEYDGPGSALLQVTVDTLTGRQGLDTDVSALKTVGHAPAHIPGVGDDAFSEPNPAGNAGAAGASAFASYGAVFGSIYIKIGGLTYVTADQGKQIVEQLHGKL